MEYYGKRKCRILKEIRAEIARANDIEWIVEECKHKGNCKGTCPRCESEVARLERELARREAMGKTVAVVGISAALSLSVTGCAEPFDNSARGEPSMENTPTHAATTPEVVVPMGDFPPEAWMETESDTDPVIMDGMPLPKDDTDTETETEPATDGDPDVLMGEPIPEPGETE